VDGSEVLNAFLPFGGGTHMCPGCFFMMNEAKLMVLALLDVDRFEFTIPADQLVPPVDKRRFGMGVELPLQEVEHSSSYRLACA